MKTYKLVLLLCPLLLLLSFDSGQQAEKAENKSPISYSKPGNGAQEVPIITKEYKTLEFYILQAELWWKVLEKDKKDEHAWFNYFKANRYARLQYNRKNSPELSWPQNLDWVKESEFLMNGDDIVIQVEKNIPKSFMSYYLKVWNDPDLGKDKIPLLEKAYAINSEFYEIYDEFVLHYEVTGDRKKRKEFNKRWFNSNDFSENHLNFFYNVLITLKEGAVLLTDGDNPLFASWMLQDAKGIREDVELINISLMISQPEYRNSLFKKLNIEPLDKEYESGWSNENRADVIAHIVKNKPADLPLYFGIGILDEHKKLYEENLYYVGLALEYSTQNIDHIAELKKNYETKYLLDYLNVQFTKDAYGKASITYSTYLHGISMLWEHHKASGELKKAEEMKKLALIIAKNLEGINEQFRKNIVDYFSN